MSWIDVGRTFNQYGEPLVVSNGPISITVGHMEEILASYYATLPATPGGAGGNADDGYAVWLRHYRRAKARNAI